MMPQDYKRMPVHRNLWTLVGFVREWFLGHTGHHFNVGVEFAIRESRGGRMVTMIFGLGGDMPVHLPEMASSAFFRAAKQVAWVGLMRFVEERGGIDALESNSEPIFRHLWDYIFSMAYPPEEIHPKSVRVSEPATEGGRW